MKLRFNLFIIFTSLALLPLVAQNQKRTIVLNKDNGFKKVERLAACNLTVNAHPSYNGESAEIEIVIDNTSDGVLIFFSDNLAWKTAEDLDYPKIRAINKEVKKSLERDGIEGCKNLERITLFDHSDNKALYFKSSLVAYRDDKPIELLLPFYTAEVKNRDKKTQEIKEIRLINKERLPLTIIVELGPDEEFEALKGECEEFINKMKSIKSFCTNEKHPDNPKDKYEEQLRTLTQKVQNLRDKRLSVNNEQKVSEPFDELVTRMGAAFDGVTRKDCGKHRDPKVNGGGGRSGSSSGSGGGRKTDSTKVTPSKRTCVNNIVPELESVLKKLNSKSIDKKSALGRANKLVNEAKGLSDYDGHKSKIDKIYNSIVKKAK